MDSAMASGGDVTRTLLLGEHHRELGEVATEHPSSRVALALSAGRFPKAYRSVDPNEDAVLAVSFGASTLLVVADGHKGCDAARASVVSVYEHGADLLGHRGSTPRELVAATLEVAAGAVAEAVRQLEGSRRKSRTAITVAAAVGPELAVATVGDTAALLVGGRRPKPLGKQSPFLGPETDPATVPVSRGRLAPHQSLILMTDGAYRFTGRKWPELIARSTDSLGPLGAAEAVVRAAFAGGAGDNIAVAVLRAAGS